MTLHAPAANRTTGKPTRDLTVKGFSHSLLRRIKNKAKADGRSMNAHILRLLAEAHR